MSSRERILSLRDSAPVILPSLLLCDFGNLEREIRALEDAGVKALHLDVMDGVFVPNFTYGMTIVEAIRRLTELPLDVHLMIQSPGKYLKAFADAGADAITFHIEAEPQAGPLLAELKRMEVAAGVVLNPGTPLHQVESCLADCDMLLVMSVDAGFGGQAFNPVALEKLKEARQIGPPNLVLEIDGGINLETVAESVAAGAQWLVVGSGIFNEAQYDLAVQNLLEKATTGSR